jgi:hypothetical protein
MKIFTNSRYQFVFFLLLFFVINILQGAFTGLLEDEAYYWVWSLDLAFGYFDHPPLVALWIKISDLFFDGEFGLRFMSTISFSLMLWVIWVTIDVKDKWHHVALFFLLIVSAAMLQIFGFIITPDTPLLLFTALFILAYKRFLSSENFLNVLFLGFSMAGMIYSKYHGILVIGFVVISHWKLLKNYRFWLAGLFGLLLFIPHLVWQYENDFPSFLYHLKERGRDPYTIMNSLLHIVNMLAVVGITFPVIYYAFFKQKAKNQFELSLKYIVYGFFVFFMISTYKSQPQAQWVVIILIPLIIITFQFFVKNQKARKWLTVLGCSQLVIILIARIFLASPQISPITLETHLPEQWIPKLKKATEGKPIVFVNSYSRASIYRFYTGIKTHSYSILRGRKSQYFLKDFEANMQGENVYGATYYNKDLEILVRKNKSAIYGKAISNYYTFEKVKCIIDRDDFVLRKGRNEFQFKLANTYAKNITFDQVRFVGVFQGFRNKIIAKVPLEIEFPESLGPHQEVVLNASFENPELDSKNELSFRVALDFYDLLEGYQGNKVPVSFEYITDNN